MDGAKQKATLAGIEKLQDKESNLLAQADLLNSEVNELFNELFRLETLLNPVLRPKAEEAGTDDLGLTMPAVTPASDAFARAHLHLSEARQYLLQLQKRITV